MNNRWRQKTALFLCILLVCSFAVLPVQAAEGDEIRFLSYEEALGYFDFTNAATNWCTNFGMDPDTRLEEARSAVLAGTDPELIIRLATFSRDTGHGDEPLIVTNAFRPACYQEVIGLHDSNANTGPFRKALLWNGRSITDFWWSAEEAPGWPEEYALDLSAYDISALDLRIFYRAALRLWDNTWVNAYYAKPGCSAHNSGCAMDIMNYWLGANFATSYTYNGKIYNMEDYGLYKPLQPTGASAGETWHITCSPAVLALGNYDGALNAGYEIVHTLYYNPVSRGWTMADGRGVYIGAGVTILQLRLCQLGLLEPKYVTGYYCSATEAAVYAFQERSALGADGICGSGTLAALFPETVPVADTAAPSLTPGEISQPTGRGFTLSLRGQDDQALNAFRVETRKEGEDTWVSRLYNAPASGFGALDVDIWEEGTYAVRASAVDKAGNESVPVDCGSVFVDTTAPVLSHLRINRVTGSGFDLTLSAKDNDLLAGFRLTLTGSGGETREKFLVSDGSAPCRWTVDDLSAGIWEICVTAVDACGNEASHTFQWKFDPDNIIGDLDLRYFGPFLNKTP